MKSMAIPALALAGSLALATAACSKDNTADTGATTTGTATPAATESAAATNDHAGQFLTDVIQTNNAEIKFGQAAQDMGSTQAVKDFGKMLVDDHTKANEQATQLATANICLPAACDRPWARSASPAASWSNCHSVRGRRSWSRASLIGSGWAAKYSSGAAW